MKSFIIISAIAIFASSAVAQNVTTTAMPTQNAYDICALGPAYMSCDSKLGDREPCTQTESSASASCSCAYASSRMACNAICTSDQIDLAVGCPKPTWSYSPGWVSSSATTTPASSWAYTTSSAKKSEAPCTWTTSTTKYTTVCSSYMTKESGSGSWVYSTSTVTSTSSWSYPVTSATAASWTSAYGSTMKPSSTASVQMVSTAGAAPLQTGLGAAAAMAIAGLFL